MNAPQLSPRLSFLVEYLDLQTATENLDATWEDFQLAHLNNDALLSIEVKSRQVGWSWLSAAESVADSILVPRTTSIFMSINQDEAREKIRYARQIMEALDAEVRPRIVIDNQLEIELNNGSRLISHPGKPLRGKARANVYLDEFAHYPKDREIYTSVIPVLSKGGRLRVGSSTLGARGVFWEIYSQSLRAYPGFVRRFTPWWVIRAFCTDAVRAIREAPGMMTEQRVREFGTKRLQEIYDNLPLEDFQQEYEGAFVDETTAWISWEEIKRNQSETLICHMARTPDAANEAINALALAIRDRQIESVLYGGLDIGRKRDLTELTLIGKSNTEHTPMRLSISLSSMPFDVQKAVLWRAMDALPVASMLIDQNGLGMQLAEEAATAFGARAQGVDFTNATKELWAVNIKVQMQRGHLPIPVDRDLSYQLHSIKKKVTAAKNNVFDTDGSEKHHADKFWSLALASWAASGKGAQSERPVAAAPMVARSPY
jgi:phage FluMu gp28-like protein